MSTPIPGRPALASIVQVPEAGLLIVLEPVFRLYVRLSPGLGVGAVAGVPGCAPAPPAPGWSSFLSCWLFWLVRRVRAVCRADASR
jgi:hypothetical protein